MISRCVPSSGALAGMEAVEPVIEEDHRQKRDSNDEEVAWSSAPKRTFADAPGQQAYNKSGICPDEGHSARNGRPTKSEGTKRLRYCGLSPEIFWTVLILVAVLIVAGAGVGGGLGGSFSQGGKASAAGQSSSSSALPFTSATASPTPTSATNSSSTTTSTTTSTLSPSALVGITPHECPGANNTIYVPGPGNSFQKFCNTNWPNGEKAAGGGGLVNDLGVQILYSIDSCIDVCYQYNLGQNKGNCLAVTYNANLTNSVAQKGGNCFLKSAMGVNVVADNLVESAALIIS